jgi:sucrose phosphorylase
MLIKIRTADKAFHPNEGQFVLRDNPHLFSFVRTSPDGRSQVLCIQSVSDKPQTFCTGLASTGMLNGRSLVDLISGKDFEVSEDGTLTIQVPRYGVLWLKLKKT